MFMSEMTDICIGFDIILGKEGRKMVCVCGREGEVVKTRLEKCP